MNFKKINISVVLVFALAIAFSIKGLREPDLWWQIRTGEWILQNHKVPTKDVFSFTNFGVNWINIKWGFEALLAIVANNLGPESVFVLQIICSVLLFYFLLKTVKSLSIFEQTTFLLICLFTFIGIEYRIIGRPEMISHLFLAVYIYVLFLYKNGNARIIWLIIPLQILWANLHEAYGMGIVIIVLFTFWRLDRKPKMAKTKPILLSIISVLSIVCLAINPREFLLITKPLDIFNQVQTNKYTTELSNIFTSDYWQKEAFLFVLLTFVIIVFALKNNVKTLVEKFSLGYFILLFAFLFLSATAYRNIIFFFIIAFPLSNYVLINSFENIIKYKNIIISIALLLYISIVSNKYYTLTKSHDMYGMQVLSNYNAVGASDYILKNNLQNQKCFSDYLSSSYLLWKLQPNFKTYIDLRDLDVFTDSFFNNYLQVINTPKLFFALDKKENFKYVVLYRNATPLLHAALYADSIYTCKYVDAVAAVYVKTDEVNNADIFAELQPSVNSTFANVVNKLANPLYEPIAYDEINYNKVAAEYYLNVGMLSLAENRINKYLSVYKNNASAMQIQSKINELQKQIK